MDDEEETGIRIKVYYHYWLFSCVLLTFFSFCFSFFLSFFLLSILGILSFTVLALEANFFFAAGRRKGGLFDFVCRSDDDVICYHIGT